MVALRELFAQFDVKFDSAALERGSAAVEGVFGQLGKLKTALLSGAIIGGIAAFTSHVIEQGDQLQTTSDRLGIATDALQAWQYVADLSDVSVEDMNTSLRFLQKNLYEASTGGGDIAATFAKLGVKVKDGNGHLIDTEDALAAMADHFKDIQDPAERTALAIKTLGRGGAALVPLLSRGSEGIQELRDEFQALGGGLSKETVAAANDADDAFKRLKFGLSSLAANAMTPFIKVATWVADKLKDGVVWFNKVASGTEVLKAAFVVLGTAAAAVAVGILISFAPIIGTFLLIGAGIAAVVLIVDDLIVMFEGGQSAIGDFLDEAFGVGTAATFVETMKVAWENLVLTVKDAWAAIEGGKPILEFIWQTFSGIGQTISFVVDQFKDFFKLFDGKGEFTEGLAMLLGLAPKPGQDKHIQNGADGFGSTVEHRDAQGNYQATKDSHGNALDSGKRGGFFEDFTRFAGDSKANVSAMPAVAGGPIVLPETKVGATVNVNVAANARPDQHLVNTVTEAVHSGLARGRRNDAASVPR